MQKLKKPIFVFPKWPIADEKEQKYVNEVLESRDWWRMTGTKVTEFEQKFALAHGVKHALAVTNGTHAIELALMALEIGAGDEVIVPAYTFISTATPVFRQGATPVAVDVISQTLCIDPDAIEKAITSKTKAIILVHFAGHAADIDRIMEIARKHNLFVIEDAAHAHGGSYNGKSLGSFGDIACFSFQYLKLMTAGEGGAIVTNNDKLIEKCWLYHNVGRPKNDRSYAHTVLGSNYRMTELQAAVLIAQLERLEEQNKKRMIGAEELHRLFAKSGTLGRLIHLPEAVIHPYYMFMLRYVAKDFGGRTRLEFVDTLKEAGVPAFIGYSAIHETQIWKDFNGKSLPSPVAEKAAKEMIWLHHSVLLGELNQQVELVKYIAQLQEEWNK